MTLSQQLDKIYLWAAHQKGLEQGAEFLKSLIVKYDVIENKKVKRGTTTHKTRKQTAVL